MTFEVIFGAVYVAAAFGAAVTVVMGLAAMLHWGRHREHGLLPYVFYAVFFALAFDVLLSGRDYQLPLGSRTLAAGGSPLALWVSRAASLFLVVAAVERIARRFVHTGPAPALPVLLMAAFGFYFLTNTLAPAFLGVHPYVSHELLYPLLAISAALLFTRSEGETAVRVARNALLLFLLASAILALARPDMVFRAYDQSMLPGLERRFVGLAPHANALGALCVVFLLCLWTKPFPGRLANALAWVLGLASLALTQSKTSWAAFVLCGLCVVHFRLGGLWGRALVERSRSLSAASALLALMIMLLAAGAALILGQLDDPISAYVGTRAGAELVTLTGRDLIWEIAVQEWQSSPVFGYGLTIWNDVHRAALGIRWAHHAHNQFYQSLAMAGLAGVVGLVTYVAILGWSAVRTARASQGLSLALLILILVRSISEVPLSIASNNLELMVHLLLVMVIASALSREHADGRRAARAPAGAAFNLSSAMRSRMPA